MVNNSIKILVIDDLQDNLITLNALIKDAFPEATILNASSGEKGLELAINENPDVILLDVLMPGMDGYEVCHKLKADKELCDIPVVFVTAIENNKAALVKALECGCEAFLTKPIDEIELTAQIRAMNKIREANNAKKDDKVRLEKLVEERSKELIQELNARKQAEEALRESELQFRSLFENAADAVFIAEEQSGIILDLNQSAEKLMQMERDELIGLHQSQLHPPEEYVFSVETFEQHRKQLQIEKRTSSFENKVKRRDGSLASVEILATKVNFKGKDCIMGTFRDVTDRKKVEESNKELFKRFELIGLHLPGVIYQFRRRTDGSFHFPYASHGIRMIYNVTPEEVEHDATNAFKAIHPDDLERVSATINHSAETLDPWHDVYRINHSSGKVIWVEGNSTPIKLEDGSVIWHGFIQNITERKQAEEKIKVANLQLQANEEALKISEERLDLAMMVKNEGIWDWYLTTNQVDFDPRYYTMAGYEPGDFTNNLEEFQQRIHPEDVAYVMSTAEQYLTGQIEQFQVEFRLKCKDNSWIWIQGRGQIVERDEKGTPLRFIGTHSDITERKQAEKELSKLSTAVEQSPSVIAITDTKGNLQYVNPQFTQSTGYSLKEAIGRNPRILKSGEQPDTFYKELWETISSGNIWRGEFHNRKKNDELFWEIASVSPIFDEQGKIVNYIKVAEDITERKQMEENFRHSIDESPLGIRIVNQKGKTIYVNRALLDIYEFSSPEEFLNTRAIERYTKQSYQEHQERKKIRQKGGDAYDYEISIRRKNGEVRHIKVWRKQVIWDREKHFQVINQDVTELKRLNNDLIQAKEKAEESDRLKSAFLANMSHEIRTPMNGILGFTGLLKEPQLTGGEKDDYIRIIEKSGNRMLNTINDIIDISKIEAGQVKVVKSEVSVSRILDEQYNFFYHQAKSKGLELICKSRLTEQEDRFVTDKHKLEGILTNLIKNAIKFTQQGEITFACSLKNKKGIEVLEFYVKDTGIGIPAHRMDAIFNHFEQADIEDTRVHQGSGLGLAIAKSYVEMLGGEITVSSEVDSLPAGKAGGSTFTFNIPYTKQVVKQSGVKGIINKEKQSTLSNLSVIIAEDDETSIMLFKAIFKNEFKNITYTKNGQETIDKCRENPETDLILMDVKMPDINGYDATRAIRKFNSNVVIIAQTAFGLSGDKDKALKAGCNGYIAKPISKDLLLEKIRKCFDKKAFNIL